MSLRRILVLEPNELPASVVHIAAEPFDVGARAVWRQAHPAEQVIERAMLEHADDDGLDGHREHSRLRNTPGLRTLGELQLSPWCSGTRIVQPYLTWTVGSSAPVGASACCPFAGTVQDR